MSLGSKPRISRSPAGKAAWNGDIEKLVNLVSVGERLDRRSSAGLTPLMEAVIPRTRHVGTGVMRYLLATREVDIDAVDRCQRTALILASLVGAASAVAELLAAGAKIEKADRTGLTALCYAAAGGHLRIIDLLLENGARIDSSHVWQVSPLVAALLNDRLDGAKYLLRLGADIDRTDSSGDTALMIVARLGLFDAIDMLIGAGASVYTRNAARRNVLTEAIFTCQRDMIDHLLSRGRILKEHALAAQYDRNHGLSCGVCFVRLQTLVEPIVSHFAIEHACSVSRAEARRMLTVRFGKDRSPSGRSVNPVGGGLPSLGKRR